MHLRATVRLSVAVLAAFVFIWAAVAMRRPELVGGNKDLLWETIAGETFTSAELQVLRTPCGEYARNDHPHTAAIAAATAVRDLELALVGASAPQINTLATCAQGASRHLLEINPASSFGWLLLAWTSRLTDPERADAYLERSVAMSPRELWMAVRRAPLMETELVQRRFDFVRGDYRTLAAGERPVLAARLLRACAAINPFCEQNWNVGLTPREKELVWREMTREVPN